MSKDAIFLGIAITGLSCLGVLSILIIVFCPSPTDKDQAILHIVSVLTPTLIALVGAFKSIEAKKEVVNLKTTVEGNKDHLEKQAAEVSNLNAQVKDVQTTATIAAETAVNLANKVDKIKGV